MWEKQEDRNTGQDCVGEALVKSNPEVKDSDQLPHSVWVGRVELWQGEYKGMKLHNRTLHVGTKKENIVGGYSRREDKDFWDILVKTKEDCKVSKMSPSL